MTARQSVLIIDFLDPFENCCDGAARCFADITIAAENQRPKKRGERLIVHLGGLQNIIVAFFSIAIIDDLAMLQIASSERSNKEFVDALAVRNHHMTSPRARLNSS